MLKNTSNFYHVGRTAVFPVPMGLFFIQPGMRNAGLKARNLLLDLIDVINVENHFYRKFPTVLMSLKSGLLPFKDMSFSNFNTRGFSILNSLWYIYAADANS